MGNFEKRKDVRRDLDEQPRNDCVCDRDLVNVARFQLSEKLVNPHRLVSTARCGLKRLQFTDNFVGAELFENRRNPPAQKHAGNRWLVL